MLTVFLRKICILGIAEYFLIVLFQISEIKKDEIRFKKYIFLLDMFLIVGGEGSSNRNASRDESVEAGDKSVEAGDESIEAGEKTPQSCYNNSLAPGGFDYSLKLVNFKLISTINILSFFIDSLFEDSREAWLIKLVSLWVFSVKLL